MEAHRVLTVAKWIIFDYFREKIQKKFFLIFQKNNFLIKINYLAPNGVENTILANFTLQRR